MKESKVNHIFCYSPKMNVAYLGLCFSFAWFFGIQMIVTNETSDAIQNLLYIGVTCGCLIFAVVSKVIGRNLSRSPLLQIILSLAMVSCSLLLISPSYISGFNNAIDMRLIGVLAGIFVGWQYMLWGSFYCKLDMKNAIIILFETVIVAAVLKVLIVFLHSSFISDIVYSIFPLVSVLFWIVAYDNPPHAQASLSQFDNARSLLSLKRSGIGIVAFSFAVGLLLSFQSGLFNLDIVSLIIAQIITVVICIFLMLIAFYRQEDFDFISLWSVVLLAIAVGVILAGYPLTGAEKLSSSVFTAANMFVVAFYWLTLTYISHNSIFPSDTIYGFGWILYSLPIGLGLICAQLLNDVVNQLQISLFIQFILMIVLYLFMRDRPPNGPLLLRDSEPPLTKDRLVQLTNQIDKLAAKYGMTEREKEIIVYYAQGRSRVFISSKLYISENTVRDHIKSVYKKMNIHDKQDLINRIEKIR